MVDKQPNTEPCLIKGEDGKCKIHHVPKKALKEYAELFNQNVLWYNWYEHLYNKKKTYKNNLVLMKQEYESIKAEKKSLEDNMVLAEANLIKERQAHDQSKANLAVVEERNRALINKLEQPKPVEPVVIELTPAQKQQVEYSEPVRQEPISDVQLNQAPIKENKPPKEVKFIVEKGKDEVSSDDEEEEADSSDETEA